MLNGHHHLHVRKRVSLGLEPYPSRRVRIWLIDRVVYAVSIAAPILTVPQVIDIYIGQNAAGVSALTWGAYMLFTIPWLAYGIVHKENVLIFNNSLWFFLNAVIFIGAVIY